MLAYLLNTGNLQKIAFKCENQPIKARQFDGPLSLPVPFEGMASQHGKGAEFIDIPGLFDDVDPLDEFSCHISAICLFRKSMPGILLFEFARSKSDLHDDYPDNNFKYSPFG